MISPMPRHLRYLKINEYLGGSTIRLDRAKKNQALATAQSADANVFSDVIPAAVSYGGNMAYTGSAESEEMLGGPEETLG